MRPELSSSVPKLWYFSHVFFYRAAPTAIMPEGEASEKASYMAGDKTRKLLDRHGTRIVNQMKRRRALANVADSRRDRRLTQKHSFITCMPDFVYNGVAVCVCVCTAKKGFHWKGRSRKEGRNIAQHTHTRGRTI